MLPIRILELRFGFHGFPTEFEEAVAPMVGEFAAVPGLVWKIWLVDEEAREAVGICLFSDRESVSHFRSGRLLAELQAHPAITGIEARELEVIGDLTRITRGPVRVEVGADGPRAADGGARPRSPFRERRSGSDRRAGVDRRRRPERRRGQVAVVYPDRRSGRDRRREERRALRGEGPPG